MSNLVPQCHICGCAVTNTYGNSAEYRTGYIIDLFGQTVCSFCAESFRRTGVSR